MPMNVKGCYSSILSGSGSELHYCQGIESTSAMHGIASMYRYLKQFEADDASRQVYFTEPAAVYGGNRLRYVTVLICCVTLMLVHEAVAPQEVQDKVSARDGTRRR